jgi:hydrogenase nickel incorporation protein HypB
MFVSADCVLITKNDLLPYVPFDIQACRETLSRFSSEMPVFEVSAETVDGMDQWLGWLKHQYPGISRPHCSVSN